MQFAGFFWFLLTIVPLVFIQRLLHREIQVVVFLITRNLPVTIGVFSIIFLPGVFLHELSHFLAAKILRVRTRGFSLIPSVLEDGQLLMGYVETEPTDIIRDSLIGLAPLITGTLFIAYASIDRLHLHQLWVVFSQYANYGLFLKGVMQVPKIADVYFWGYLAFAVSSTMMPSDSDRHAWIPMGLWISAVLALAIVAGAGTWMLTNLAPALSDFLYAVALLFGLSIALHALLMIPLVLLHRFIAWATKTDVQYKKL